MLIFDAHLDLSLNALERNRDYRRPLAEIRERERGQSDRVDRGKGTVCLPEMRLGQVGICVATLIARYVKPTNQIHGWHSPEQAWAQTQGQLAWYRAMEEAGEMTQIRTAADLDAAVEVWSGAPPLPTRRFLFCSVSRARTRWCPLLTSSGPTSKDSE